MSPQTPLEALAGRRLPVSGWPWRSLGYVLATMPAALIAAALLAVLAVPWLILAGGPFPAPTLALVGRYVASFSWRASTVPQSVPFCFAGLVLLVLWSYLVTLVAGADAAVTRALLFGGGPEARLRAELTEVAASRARLAGAFEA